ncbi:hypothetical protein C7974DRAFT_390992 [Boeremia exigua]|uniref:uncharacterized protein n=1 Tax=Boeremia exigua TaxID=749465 RepID=UPI001E8EAFDE|nr:uncharacterized protein C7974DRAFT_390992 [Boeremia exigua]KAH6638169.1 hypothetical protein C7974DRAFT_390992 [Boeremia exigua]
MASCLLPTIQLLQPTTTNPVLRPKLSFQNRNQPNHPAQRQRKLYPTSKRGTMRPALLPLLSLLGITSAQSTWAQTQPFEVDGETDSLLGSSSVQGLTNEGGSTLGSEATLSQSVVTLTQGSGSASTVSLGPGASQTTLGGGSSLAPVPSITGLFSTTLPTELGTVVTVTRSAVSGSGSAGVSGSASTSAASSDLGASESASASSRSVSAAASSSRASSSGTGAAVQSTAAAAPVGVNGQHKMMGVAGALAGAAGVLFV